MNKCHVINSSSHKPCKSKSHKITVIGHRSHWGCRWRLSRHHQRLWESWPLAPCLDSDALVPGWGAALWPDALVLPFVAGYVSAFLNYMDLWIYGWLCGDMWGYDIDDIGMVCVCLDTEVYATWWQNMRMIYTDWCSTVYLYNQCIIIAVYMYWPIVITVIPVILNAR